ncbi:MAG: hypothetical protein KGI83_00870 [Verrucomicrobiota bacterium]|nr:hypothetical protein [Verrucomicrobiota bacterium]
MEGILHKKEIRDQGLMGTLFWTGAPKSAVIVLGGSSGGLPESRAEALAAEGYYALALAYFGVGHLPQRLSQIPLEYFEAALTFLSNFVDQVGLWGISRGAELSLILGTLFPERIDALAAHVPSSVVYGTLDGTSLPAWVYRGEQVAPSAPFALHATAAGDSMESAIATTPSFLASMADPTAFASSAIPVEKLQCPLLLVSAEDDQMWPSTLFAKQIIERLQTFRSPLEVSHIVYPKVGHSPGRGGAGMHPVWKRWFAYGGSPAENAAAAVDWLQQTVSFFKARLD